MTGIAFVLLALCATASARLAYQLPSGAEIVLKGRSVTETFTCDGLPYGYYADDANDCEIFHICLPVNDDQGALVETAQFSFLCPNATIFDQTSLVCALEAESLPCSEAKSSYETSNAQFGVLPDGTQTNQQSQQQSGQRQDQQQQGQQQQGQQQQDQQQQDQQQQGQQQ